MIQPLTVLTLTYNRYNILQEAIQSFVSQGADDCEMLIINDQDKVDYTCDIPNVRIINCKTRFPLYLINYYLDLRMLKMNMYID